MLLVELNRVEEAKVLFQKYGYESLKNVIGVDLSPNESIFVLKEGNEIIATLVGKGEDLSKRGVKIHTMFVDSGKEIMVSNYLFEILKDTPLGALRDRGFAMKREQKYFKLPKDSHLHQTLNRTLFESSLIFTDKHGGILCYIIYDDSFDEKTINEIKLDEGDEEVSLTILLNKMKGMFPNNYRTIRRSLINDDLLPILEECGYKANNENGVLRCI